jgi:hypothetical protein
LGERDYKLVVVVVRVVCLAEGLIRLKILGMPKMGTTGRKRSLGRSSRDVRNLKNAEVE